MATLKPQLLHRGKAGFLLIWRPLPGSQVKHFNVYKSSSENGAYTLFRSEIGNDASLDPIARGHVAVSIKDTEIPFIGITSVYFKITSVDRSNVESDIAQSLATRVDVPNISTLYEGENGDRNSHLYGWDEPNRFWTKLRTSPDGVLKVDIGDSLNLNVSNVKIAARADNTTLEYLLVDADRKLVVTIPDTIDVDIGNTVSIIESTSSIIDAIEDVSVEMGVETTILSHTVIEDFMLVNICGTGSADAHYRLKITGDLISKKRTSWTTRNADFNFGKQGIKVMAGDIIEVTAEHEETADQTFDASLFGYKSV